ncbi:putative type VI secretion system effector [Xanthomonas bromi]|uniref:Uncharacterized protein n=1 Tax=Xanthomonas bromi TaxID=56449 RepID=A0ABX5BJB3_9XANT|nr:putative type VI secretion system effector [Xanthomonas bromi]PPV03225.1 hypothetical protein XbrCFBP1976_21625 [Xanthomonas bromi]
MAKKEQVQVLNGILSNVKVTNTIAEVFFHSADREGMAATGVVAAALGESGLAAGMVAMSTEEMSDQVCLVSFDLDGKHVEGMLWNWPFKEGDEVRAVVESRPSGDYLCFAVLDPKECIIALYPHVSAGKSAHWRNLVKISSTVTSAFIVFMVAVSCGIFFLADNAKIETLLKGLSLAILIFIFISVWVSRRMGRRFIPFVEMAEPIFTLLGWKDVKNIDLRKITKAKKKPTDPPAMGDSYFRY